MIRTESEPQSMVEVADLYDLGYVERYGPVWELQKKLRDERIERKAFDSLILVEHGNVITLGKSSHLENVLVKDLPTFEIERGGDVTYHGPGQLVAYPIISLEERALGVRQYVELLESVVVESLQKIGLKDVQGKLGRETGVWINNSRKIASVGVAVSHWVTFHGFALNVNTDLSYFHKIKPCGFEANIMTSISKEFCVKEVSMREIKEVVTSSFASKFGWRFREALARLE